MEEVKPPPPQPSISDIYQVRHLIRLTAPLVIKVQQLRVKINMHMQGPRYHGLMSKVKCCNVYLKDYFRIDCLLLKIVLFVRYSRSVHIQRQRIFESLVFLQANKKQKEFTGNTTAQVFKPGINSATLVSAKIIFGWRERKQ